MKMCNIWVTGCRGFIGSNMVKKLSNWPDLKIYATSHDVIDIQNEKVVLNFVNENNIKGIIHCSGVGGKRVSPTTVEDAYTNLRMHEILNLCEPNVDFILSFGSGAEFDRRNNIHQIKEDEALNVVPNDYYGFCKNVINRRIQQSNKWYNLRLFGCFHSSEEEQRFIKSCILKRMKNEEIVIHQNKYMDFFYLEDLVYVVKYYVRWASTYKLPRSINMCYEDKITLLDIAKLIHEIVPGSNNEIVTVHNEMGLGYCGDGTLLKNSFRFQYKGLVNGIRETYDELKLHS